MKWLLCLVLGHQKTLMPFTANRFVCGRCGADLGRDLPDPPPAVTCPATQPLRPHVAARLYAASRTPRPPTRTRLARVPRPPQRPRRPPSARTAEPTGPPS